MAATLVALAAVFLSVMFGSGAEAGICASNPPNGHFELLGSARDVSHYRLRCRVGFKVTPARADTLLSCRGSTLIKAQTATCTRQVMTCLPSEFKCRQQHECVPSRVVCDGRPNCRDQTDESPAACGRGMACTPKPEWMHGDPNVVFQRLGIQRNTGIVEYGVSCVEGYRLGGHDMDASVLQCSAGNVIKEPTVHCERIRDGDPCILDPTQYLIENYHDDQLDLDIDSHSEQKPGTILTVRCKKGGEAVIAYCNVDGTFEGQPDCSRRA